MDLVSHSEYRSYQQSVSHAEYAKWKHWYKNHTAARGSALTMLKSSGYHRDSAAKKKRRSSFGFETAATFDDEWIKRQLKGKEYELRAKDMLDRVSGCERQDEARALLSIALSLMNDARRCYNLHPFEIDVEAHCVQHEEEKEEDSKEKSEKSKSVLYRIATHPYFAAFILMAITLNIILCMMHFGNNSFSKALNEKAGGCVHRNLYSRDGHQSYGFGSTGVYWRLDQLRRFCCGRRVACGNF